MKQTLFTMQEYIAPQIEIISVETERGFATSSEGGLEGGNSQKGSWS